MTSDVLERCPRCGEEERRCDVRSDDAGTWWLIGCSVKCPPRWELIVATMPAAEPEIPREHPCGRADRAQQATLRLGLRVDEIEERLCRRLAALEARPS